MPEEIAMRRSFAALLLVVVTAATRASTQDIGPASGTLVVVGGGQLDQSIIERFIQLAGGTDAATRRGWPRR